MRRTALLLALGLASCTSVEHVDLAPYLIDSEIQLSEGEPPPGAQPIGMIAVENTGWYLLGLLPIVSVRFETCIEEMLLKAKEYGAQGISNMRAAYTPPSFWRFAAIGLPDWSASVAVTGMAYQLPGAPPPGVYR